MVRGIRKSSLLLCCTTSTGSGPTCVVAKREARAVESHVGSNDRSLRTVLLSTIRSRNFMFQMCFACAFGRMRVVMRAHSSPMQHDKQLDAMWHACM